MYIGLSCWPAYPENHPSRAKWVRRGGERATRARNHHYSIMIPRSGSKYGLSHAGRTSGSRRSWTRGAFDQVVVWGGHSCPPLFFNAEAQGNRAD
jgi:hypothetical protein